MTTASYAASILTALGGSTNIEELEPCVTRLRALVLEPGLINSAALKEAGAHGVMINGRVVQVIVGPLADVLASEIDDLL